MANQYPLSAANGPQVVPIIGGAVGSHLLYLAFGVAPGAGTVKVEWRPIGATTWQQLQKVNGVAMPGGELAFRIDGPLAALRVTFAGLVGGNAPVLWLSSNALPSAAFGGDAAITVQSYPELNSKHGSQFDVTTYIPALAAATWSYTLVTTGALPIAIKGRKVQFDSIGIRLIVYKNPTLIGTPGTPVIPSNLNDRNPNAPLVQLRGGITAAQVSNLGTVFRPAYELLGSEPVGNAIAPSGGDEAGGAEIILAENTSYLWGVLNRGSAPCRYSSYTTWYEGELDVPL